MWAAISPLSKRRLPGRIEQAADKKKTPPSTARNDALNEGNEAELKRRRYSKCESRSSDSSSPECTGSDGNDHWRRLETAKKTGTHDRHREADQA